MRNGKHVVLCIDDDRELLDSVESILESAGYEVETATSVDEAVAKYRATGPDLVLVDLMMEEADSGFAFVRAIRALGPTPPLYLLSGVGADLTALTEFTEIGLTDVLQKPVDPSTLIRLVRSKVRNRKQAEEQ